MVAIRYEKAAACLSELFKKAEEAFSNDDVISASPALVRAADSLFASSTQSYREVLLGCGIARYLDDSINIRLPYAKQGDGAFNGRSLDERVINPFLQDRMIPCSKGPYLAVFRRSVELKHETASGLRDKEGYTAMMEYLSALEKANKSDAQLLIVYLLYRFVMLRDASNVVLSRISRLSLEQQRITISSLLKVQSGGLIPVVLVVAMLRAIKLCHSLNWVIEWQGINVADKASGAGGDITVKKANEIVLAVEVTERPIGEDRVVSTFNTKIVRAGIEDYIFMYAASQPSEKARHVAKAYFSQGHEINFLQVESWIVNNLGTLGGKCRTIFITETINLLASREVPGKIKVAWNDVIKSIVQV